MPSVLTRAKYVGDRVLDLATERRHVSKVRAVAAQTARRDPAAQPYLGLDPYSLFLDSATFSSSGPRMTNAFVPTLRSSRTFAGVRTALKAACRLASLNGTGLQLISYEDLGKHSATEVRHLVSAEFGFDGPVHVFDLTSLPAARFTDDDTWLVTLWGTAHTLDLLARRERVDRAKVVYLVQDYEPLFYPASSRSMLARTTYHAGFVPLVNSRPLATYLASEETVTVPDSHVFAPELDMTRIAEAAASRPTVEQNNSVIAYYRPSSRNMAEVALSAMRCLHRELASAGKTATLSLVGSSDGNRHAGNGLQSLGRLAWDDYFKLLARTKVIISLQATPHPSHPPLDMVASGGHAVTNAVGESRSGLHPRLHAVESDPEALAQAALEILAESTGPGDLVSPDFLRDQLGAPFTEAVAAAFEAVQ